MCNGLLLFSLFARSFTTLLKFFFLLLMPPLFYFSSFLYTQTQTHTYI